MNYPGIGENETIYAVGDIHGRSDLLDRTIALIDADRASRPPEGVTEIYLGDYVDRGPDSAGVLARLRRRGDERGDLVCLLGNHEAMLLDAVDDPALVGQWLDNGGDATLASYGGKRSWLHHRSADLSAIPAADVAFMRALRRMHRHGPYLFVHAGIRPGVPLAEQNPEDLFWIRDEFLRYDGPLGAVVVHGHTPEDMPDFRANRINIDTGAVFSGRLTCLRIDSEGVRLLA